MNESTRNTYDTSTFELNSSTKLVALYGAVTRPVEGGEQMSFGNWVTESKRLIREDGLSGAGWSV